MWKSTPKSHLYYTYVKLLQLTEISLSTPYLHEELMPNYAYPCEIWVRPQQYKSAMWQNLRNDHLVTADWARRQHSTEAVTNLQGTLYRIKFEFSVSHVSQSTESHFLLSPSLYI